VFRSLYRDACAQATLELEEIRAAAEMPPLPFDLSRSLERSMTELFPQLQHLDSARDAHRHQLTSVQLHQRLPSSESTCFVCVRRRPQYCLPCRHWVCQTCVCTFARLDAGDPYLFHADECLLCGATAGPCIRVRPATATTRILSIDGGGTRGRAPLEFLSVLQEAIGLPYPVQQNFDVVFGTSSGTCALGLLRTSWLIFTGALIACALCINGWPVDQCIEYFETSSKLAFEESRYSRIVRSLFHAAPFVAPAVELVKSLLVDCKYAADQLEAIQQEAYGARRSIVDSAEASRAGTMVGVTLTSAQDSSTFIVTNYNAENHENQGTFHPASFFRWLTPDRL